MTTTPSPEALALKPCPFCSQAVEIADVPTASEPIIQHPPYDWRCCLSDKFFLASSWNQRPTPSGEVVQVSNAALADWLEALACDCASTDGWEKAAPDLRLAAHRLASSGAGEPVALRRALQDASEYINKLNSDIRSRVYRAEELNDLAAWADVDAFAYNGDAASIEAIIADALATPPHLPPAELLDNRVEGVVQTTPIVDDEYQHLMLPGYFNDRTQGTVATPDEGGVERLQIAAVQAVVEEYCSHHLIPAPLATNLWSKPRVKAAFAALRALPASRETARIEPVGDEALVERVDVEPSDAKTAEMARLALGRWLAWPDAARDGPVEVDNSKVCSWLQGVPAALAKAIQAIPAPATDAGQSADSLVEAKVIEWAEDALRQAFIAGADWQNDGRPGYFRDAIDSIIATHTASLPKSPSAGEEA